MLEGGLPAVVDLLVRLRRHWHFKARGHNRRKQIYSKRVKSYENKRAHFNRKRDLLVRLTFTPARYAELCKRFNDKIDAGIANVDAEEDRSECDDFHHPFPDFVARVSRYSQQSVDTLHKAIKDEFSGHTVVGSALREFEQSAHYRSLCNELVMQHSDLAEWCGIRTSPLIPPMIDEHEGDAGGLAVIKIDNENNVPAEFRERGRLDGKPLTAKLIEDPVKYGVKQPYLAKYYKGRRLKLGRSYVYEHSLVAALADKIRRIDEEK